MKDIVESTQFNHKALIEANKRMSILMSEQEAFIRGGKVLPQKPPWYKKAKFKIYLFRYWLSNLILER